MSEIGIGIGSTIYEFDENRRFYDKHGHCIYAEHFVPHIITGETRVSWVIGNRKWDRRSIKKAMLRDPAPPYAGFFTAKGMQDKIWRNGHRPNIRDLLDRATADQLRAVGKILGYAPAMEDGK